MRTPFHFTVLALLTIAPVFAGSDPSSQSLKAVEGQMNAFFKQGGPKPGTAAPDFELERARGRYFDALVEVQTNGSGKASEEFQRNLSLTKDKYNEVRRSQGLEKIK